MGLRSLLSNKEKYATILDKESQRAKGGLPSLHGGATLRTKERRDCQCMLHMRVYSNFVSSLSPSWDCATQSSGVKNSRQLLPVVDGRPRKRFSRHFQTVTTAR